MHTLTSVVCYLLTGTSISHYMSDYRHSLDVILVCLRGALVNCIVSYIIVSECWMFYAVPTARVIFVAKTSLDVFSLR